MQIQTFRTTFEAIEYKLEPFKRDSNHSNANSNHSNDIWSNRMQIWNNQTWFEAVESKF